MTNPTTPRPTDRSLEAAIAWHERLRGADARDELWDEFAAWLEADEANRIAYDRVEDLHVELDAARVPLAPLWAKQSGNMAGRRKPPRRALSFARLPMAASLGAAMLAATLFAIMIIQRPPGAPTEQTYSTRVGETKAITLSDGSAVELGPGSSLAATMTAGVRQARLERGEALFRVVHDPARPFVVGARDRDIKDIGTVFDVRLDGGRVTVTVAEGNVRVSSSGQDNAVHLSAGEQLVYRPGVDEAALRRIDPATILAWRQGFLTYENASLSEVVEDLNRYFPHRILLNDTTLGARPFSGVLQVGSEEVVLTRLTKLLSLAADHNADGSVVLRAAPGRD